METIGVNLLWLEPGVVGGSEEYTLSLLRAVHGIDPLDLELKLFVHPSLLDHHPDLDRRFEVVVAPKLPGGKAGRIAAEHTWLSRQSVSLSLVHHAGGVVPSGSPTASVLTVLDLQPLEMPENFGTFKRNWLGQMIPRSAQQADIIVTPSEFTAERMVDLLGVARDRIRVVPFGLDVPDRDAVDAQANPAPDSLGEGPVFLYPAIAYAHKRHVDLIEAFSLLQADHPTAKLVLTGGAGPLTDQVRAQAEPLGDAVVMPGRIDRDELEFLYRRADAVVIPSEYEGFGLPALEAMAVGTPVIVANAGSLPEVVGAAALVVPPRDPVELARAMRSVVAQPAVRQRLEIAGPQRAQEFQWKTAGQALITAYRDALVRVDLS